MPRDEDRPRALRLFVAIELPESTRRELAAAAEALRGAGAGDGVRWVRPEGIHITLKFLGAVDPGRVEAINTALRIVVQGARPFTLQPEGTGTFGSPRSPRVVWVGVGGDTDALADLAGSVQRGLAPLGFPPEERAFNAHLTLGRVREDATSAERARVAEAVAGLNVPRFTLFHVEHVSLMRSHLGPGGARYEALQVWKLEEPGTA